MIAGRGMGRGRESSASEQVAYRGMKKAPARGRGWLSVKKIVEPSRDDAKERGERYAKERD